MCYPRECKFCYPKSYLTGTTGLTRLVILALVTSMLRTRIRLQTEKRLSKLLLLKGYTDLAGQLRQYSSRVFSIPDLFRTEKLPTTFASVASHSQTDSKKQVKPIIQQSDPEPELDTSEASDEVEVIEWVTEANQTNKKKGKGKVDPVEKKAGKKVENGDGEDEWVEARKGKKGKGGVSKAGKKVQTSVRKLDPRPCHTCVDVFLPCVKRPPGQEVLDPALWGRGRGRGRCDEVAR